MCARKVQDDDFGTRQPPLTEFLKNLLQRYTEGGQILKELIQNADDAKASRVKFCIDDRQHSIDPGGLWKPSLAPFQGPALLAWNDSVFTDEDWRNIGKMHQSMKEEDVLKVGRFGLGFQSVHNITDLPTIVSGDCVGIMDPHETVIKNEGKTGKRFPLEEFNIYAAQSAPFEGMFGFSNHANHYDGTLFRFPFRNDKFISKISDRMYSADEAHRVLYESLAEEAPRLLLFLNHVTTVELYRQVHSSKSFQPELLLRIAIEGGNVSTTRQWCIEKSMASQTAKGLQTPVCSISECAISVEGPLSRGAAWYSYLVCNTVGSSNAEMVDLAKKLKVIPWVGLAAPLPGPISPPRQVFKGLISEKPDCSHIENIVLKTFHKNRKKFSIEASPAMLVNKGFAFCFLPMSSNNDTGLPVHIHGYFSLSDNRRRVRWPDLDDQSDEAKWNKCLVRHLISPSYAVLITTSCSLMNFQFPLFSYQQLCKSSRPFALLPLMSATREKAWEYLVKKVLPLLSNLPVLWTPAGGGNWVKPCEAFYPPLNRTIPNSILDLLIQFGLPVVCFPRHIQQDCQLPFAEVTPQVVRKWFRSNEMLKSKVKSDLSLLKDCLRFVTSDRTDELTNIPLLLLKSGQVVPFGQQKVYLVNESLSKVLHNLDKLILSNVLYTDLGKLFNQLARSKINKLIVANSQIVCNSLLPASIQTWTHTHVNPVQWTPNRNNHPSAEWLLNVWTYITNNEVIGSVTTLPLVVSEGPENVTNEGTYSLYRLDTGKVFCSGSNRDVNYMAQLLGCVLVKHSCCYFRLGPKLSQYLPKLNPEGLLHVLPNLPQVAQRVSQLLNDEQKRQLRLYLSSASQSLNSLTRSELNCIRSLPIFECVVGKGRNCFTNLMSPHVYILPLPTIQFPTNIPFPDNILKVCHEDINLYQCAVGVVPSSLGQFAQKLYTFATKHHFTMRNALLLWLIECSNPEYQNSELEQFIRLTAIIPTANGPLQYICKLYDPKDSKLKDFFLPFDSPFPPKEYDKVLSKLRLYNLKTWESVIASDTTFLDFIEERAKSVQVALYKVSKEEAVKRSQLILTEIFKNRNCAHLLQSLKSIPFLFCNQSPPPRYPKQLLWAGSEVNRLCSPAELCLDLSHSHLVGSVLLFLSSDYPLPLGVTSQEFAGVTPNTVGRHFANITSLPSNVLKDKAVLMMIKSIYEYFAGQSSCSFLNAELACIWIDSEYKFVTKAKCALKPLGNCSLTPYRYSLQDASCLRDHKAMWLESGVSKCLTVEDGVEVVHEIHSSLGRHGTLSPEQLDTVVSVAEHLKQVNSVASISTFLLPTIRHDLRNPADLTYDNHYLQHSPSEGRNDSFCFVHKRITAEVAQFFKVQPLSMKAAPSKAIAIDFQATGPYESITHRIKCLVEDYGDNIDVFKELIQNADDAGATVVKFLISWKHFGQSHLVTKEMAAWQGPALYAYNDKTFSESDLRNICKIAGQTKLTDHTKIGRFGVGFCATYHLTDVPSFVSKNWLQIFDPHLKYLGERVQPTKPGVLIDFVKENTGLKEYYSDQIAPYEGIFGCSIVNPPSDGFDGTMFRFPFRRPGMISEICNETFTKGNIESLKRSLKESASTLLLFLQNVNSIELLEKSDKNAPSCLFKLERSGETTNPFKKSFCLPAGKDFSHPPTSQIEKIATVSLPGGKEKSTLWIVSSALGRKKSLEHVLNCGTEDGLIPFTEVAVKVRRKESSLIAQCTKGGLSCFLPLPFGCSLEFHVNGFFDVTKDRRLLKRSVWNEVLISDSLVLAVLELLQYLAKNAPDMNSARDDEFLQSYYQLYPTREQKSEEVDAIRPILAKAFEKEVHETTNKIVWTKSFGGRWMAPSEVVILSHDFLVHPFKLSQRELICNLLVSQNVPIVNVPSRLNYFFKMFTFKEFCTCFFSKIVNINPTMRDTVALFMLQQLQILSDKYTWFQAMLTSTAFIPTEPKGCLVKVDYLVDSSVADVAKLFTTQEGRFPAACYMKNRQVVAALHSLGMAHKRLRDEDVLERAHSISRLDVETGKSRSNFLVKYLLEYHFKDSRSTYSSSKTTGKLSESDKDLAVSLSNIAFLPIMKSPHPMITCWKDSDAVFMKSVDLFPSVYDKLVFTSHFILDKAVPNDLFKLLTFMRSPTLEYILEHLRTVALWWKNREKGLQNEKKVLKFLDDSTQEIYSHLSLMVLGISDASNSRLMEDKEVFAKISFILKDVAFIWEESDFYDINHVYFDEAYKCPPYLVTLDRDKLTSSTSLLLKELGVNDRISHENVLLTLQAIDADYKEAPLPEDILDFTIYCSRRLHKSKKLSNLFLPDVDCIMRSKDRLMYSDQQIQALFTKQEYFKSLEVMKSSKRQYRLHPRISFDTAQGLGIRDPLQALLSKYSDNSVFSGVGYGQHENLCDRLSNILRNYHADGSIFKEFIQNADDAGASEIVFILDQRKFKDKMLFDPSHSNWKNLQQMPSLLVFNNKKFTEEDIVGITKLGKGIKDNSPETIGRFGIGFNVAYHVTDCPVFVSHSEGGRPDHFCAFDPTLEFVPGSNRDNPGQRWRLQGESGDISRLLEDQMAPFSTETLKRLSSMCPKFFQQLSKKWPNGFAFFRLPFARSKNELRCIKTAEEMTAGKMRALFLSFCNEIGENCLLFLNSVRKIAFFEISDKNKYSLVGSFTATLDKRGTRECENFRSEMHSFASSFKSDLPMVSSSTVYDLTTETIDRHLDHKTQHWVISKRLGANDIIPELLTTAFQCSFLPLGGVAAYVPDFTECISQKDKKKDFKSDSSSSKSMVYCYLPLPHTSQLPIHVNGHFWLSDSRRDLQHSTTHQLKDWNRELVQQTVLRAYVELLIHCKKFFVQGKAFTEWFYGLFPQPDIKGVLESFRLSEILFCYLFDNNTSILTSLNNPGSWLSFNGPDKGLFYSPLSYEPKRKVLVKLGLFLTDAPPELLRSLEASLASQKQSGTFSGRISPAFLRDHLCSIAQSMDDYQDVIKANIMPLLKFVVKDIQLGPQPIPNWKSVLQGVPLMLTNNDQLRLMCMVYDYRHSELLPTCQGYFIHKCIANDVDIYSILQNLGVIKMLADNPKFVADNLALPKPSNHKVLSLHEVDKKLLLLFWWYLSDCQSEDAFQSFSSFAAIPTTSDHLYQISRRKQILFAKSERIQLINKFKFPVLCLEKVFGKNVDYINFQIFFADPDNPNEILHLLLFYKENLPQLEHIDENEVYDLINFLNGSEELQESGSQIWLRELPLFYLLDKRISRIDYFGTVYGLYKNSIPFNGLADLTDMKKGLGFILVPMYCETFLTKAGVDIVDNHPHAVLQLYRVLICHFHRECFTPKTIFPHIERLRELYYQAGPSKRTRSSWNVIVTTLSSLKFIRLRDQSIAAPKDLYDPNCEIFKAFLKDSDFPPESWDSSQWLDFLEFLGLNRTVTSQLWLSFAKSLISTIESGNEDFSISKNKSLLLLANLAEQINQSDLSPDFLRRASCFAIVPCLHKRSPNNVLEHILPGFKMPIIGWNTVKGSVIQLEDHDWNLSCLSKPVLPDEFYFSPKLKNFNSIFEALGLCRVTPILAAENLRILSKILSECKELPNRKNNLKILHELRDLFLAHYTCINSCQEKDEHELKELLETSNCLYILDRHCSFQLLQGSHTVMKHADTMFSCVEVVPDYCKSLITFLKIIGSSDDLTIHHCCIFLKTLWHNTRHGRERLSPNDQEDARGAYYLFIELARLFEEPDGSIQQDLYEGNLPLLSEKETLELATTLLLNDAPWYKERLQRTSKSNCYKFIKTPPKDSFANPSLPEWLGVRLLSSVIRETSHPKMLNEVNLCNIERVAAVEGSSQCCPYLNHLKIVLKSGYFLDGLLRLIKYETKSPPSDELVEHLKSKLNSAKLVCVRLITTVLLDENNKEISNSLDSSSPCLIAPAEDGLSCTIYIAPHERDSSTTTDRTELLYRLFVGLNQQFGHVVHDSHIFMEMLSCQHPNMIGTLLSNHQIPKYIHGSDKNFSKSHLGDNATLRPYLDHIIVFNFKVGEIIKFKKENSSSPINAKIVTLEGETLSMKCNLKIKPSKKGENDQIEVVQYCPLLLSKYMPPAYEYNILKTWKIATNLPDSLDTALPGPISFLELSVAHMDILRAELMELYTGVRQVFTHEQMQFTAVRLLYQIHYMCTKMAHMDVFDKAVKVLIGVVSSFGIDLQLLLSVKQQLTKHQAEPTFVSSTGYGGVSSDNAYLGQSSRGSSSPISVKFSGLWLGQQNFRDQLWRSHVEAEPPPQPNLEEARMWLMQALNDFKAAQNLLQQSKEIRAAHRDSQLVLEVFPAQVCFLSHESVEKCLKALFLALFGLDTKLSGHTNVMDLCQELQRHKGWASGIDLRPQVLQVSRHFMQCRYPGYNVPKQAPAYSYAKRFSETEEVVAAVQEMYHTIKEQLPNVGQMMEEVQVRLTNRRDDPIDPASLPPGWSLQCMQGQRFALVPLRITCDEYLSISELFFSSMGNIGVRIFSIDRIQNVDIWKDYASKRNLLVQRLGYCNEVTAFHGTRSHNPEAIFKSQKSFDVLKSRHGLYGPGAYFARDARISHDYVHRTTDGYYKMLVAKVLLGDAKDCTEDRSNLSLHKGERGGIVEQYDSIFGVLGTLSIIYVVHRNEQSYPAYCITYDI